MIGMAESVRVIVKEQSQTAEARRVARAWAGRAGMDTVLSEQVAIVATEVATNLIKHGGGGEVLLNTTSETDAETQPGLELLALDNGSGMPNLEQCLRDGFSTSGSPGQGLGAIRRLSSSCDIYSAAGRGTALLARWQAAARHATPHPETRLEIGAVNIAKPGQEVCGDSWGIERAPGICTIMVADGLGHGPEAKEASSTAIRMLHQNTGCPLVELLDRVHLALRSTRGAAVAIARIDVHRGTVLFAGTGNIAAQISGGGTPARHLVSTNGTAGVQIHKPREFTYPWPRDGILVMNSDGLSTKTGLEKQAGLASHHATLIAGVLYRDFTRGNDDATVVVAKAA
jgi:anti-sigma regulatory factor (Ser/Thr protein kinase)